MGLRCRELSLRPDLARRCLCLSVRSKLSLAKNLARAHRLWNQLPLLPTPSGGGTFRTFAASARYLLY